VRTRPNFVNENEDADINPVHEGWRTWVEEPGQNDCARHKGAPKESSVRKLQDQRLICRRGETTGKTVLTSTADWVLHECLVVLRRRANGHKRQAHRNEEREYRQPTKVSGGVYKNRPRRASPARGKRRLLCGVQSDSARQERQNTQALVDYKSGSTT